MPGLREAKFNAAAAAAAAIHQRKSETAHCIQRQRWKRCLCTLDNSLETWPRILGFLATPACDVRELH